VNTIKIAKHALTQDGIFETESCGTLRTENNSESAELCGVYAISDGVNINIGNVQKRYF